MILWGVDAEACAKCVRLYAEREEQVPCRSKGKCFITHRERADLSYFEFKIKRFLEDYFITGQLMTNDPYERDLLISLKSRLDEIRKIKFEIEASKRKWRTKKK